MQSATRYRPGRSGTYPDEGRVQRHYQGTPITPPAGPVRRTLERMGSEQETGDRVAEYAALGVDTTDAQIAEARAEARRKLAEAREQWTPERWAELDRRIADPAA